MAPEEAKAAAVPEAAKPQSAQQEKQANCLACNKPIKKLKRYYRDGKFYCNKKCWRTYLEKSKEEKKE